MHSLDVIILKNARAAGRELAHAHNDAPDDDSNVANETVLHGAYAQAEEREAFGGYYSKHGGAVERAFTAGWNAGKQEG